ncbi:MAG: hypothetical protein AB1505_05710 [Candidatus Latescibacterota bacterium]
MANRLRTPSYVSLQSALGFHGLIPEHLPTVTSVTSGRCGTFRTPLGQFHYRHVAPGLLWECREVEVQRGQRALMATAEKALLDLIHLTPGADRRAYLDELRLAPDGPLDPELFAALAEESGSPKLRRAAVALADALSTP